MRPRAIRRPHRAGDDITIASDACTTAKLGSDVPVEKIGEPVRRVTLAAPTWIAETATSPAYCRVEGRHRAGRHQRDGAADQLRSGTAGEVEPPRGAAWRWRHERHDPEPDRRRRAGRAVTACPRHCDLRQRLRTSSGFGPPGGRGGARPGGPGRAAADGRAGGDAPAAAPRGRGPAPGADEWALNDEAIANLGYMQMKKTHDAAMVIMERAVRRSPSIQLLRRIVAGRPRSADRRAALPGRLRRHRRQRADRQLLDADARARADSHSGEAARQLGDAGQGQRDSRRVHASVRQARRSRRRHHQQLHGVPRDLRRHAGRRRGRHPWAAKRCPGNVDPNPADTIAPRLSDRWADLDARIHLLPLRVRHTARERRRRRSACGCRTRIRPAAASSPTRASAGRKAPPPTAANALAPGRSRRDRLPDEESRGQSARLRRKAARSTSDGRNCRASSIRRTRTCAPSRSAAAR